MGVATTLPELSEWTLHHVCPVARLKTTELWLSYFPGFLFILKVWLFSKMGDKPNTKAVKQDIFSQFLQSRTKVTIKKKTWLF